MKIKKTISIVLVLSLIFLACFAFADTDKEKEIPYPKAGENSCYVQDKVGYFYIMGSVYSTDELFSKALLAFARHKVEKIVIILNSGGGSVFTGMAMAQMMAEQISIGKLVEVRCYGVAASAAAVILAAGSPGHRFIASSAMIMIHELTIVKWMTVETVSDQEKGAEISRMIQTIMLDFIASRTKLTPQELYEKCREESWASAQTAVEWGFADKLIE